MELQQARSPPTSADEPGPAGGGTALQTGLERSPHPTAVHLCSSPGGLVFFPGGSLVPAPRSRRPCPASEGPSLRRSPSEQVGMWEPGPDLGVHEAMTSKWYGMLHIL